MTYRDEERMVQALERIAQGVMLLVGMMRKISNEK